MKKLALLFLLFPLIASAQTRYDMPVLSTTSGPLPAGTLPPMLAIPNAQIAVCGYPATLSAGMCTNTITTYTDSTLGTACPSTAQLTAAGTSTCTSTTGLQGTFGFWYNSAAQSHLTYTVKASWGTFGPYDILGGGGSGGATSVPNSYLLTTLSAGIGTTDTTIPLVSVAGLNDVGTVVSGSEWIRYTGLSGNSLTGATRGYHLTSPASYSSGTSVYSVPFDFTNPGQAPNSYVMTYGNGSTQFSVFNCNSPDLSEPLTLQVNCDANGFWVNSNGGVAQLSTGTRNIFESSVGVGPGGGLATITNSGYLFDSTRQNNSTVPQGFQAGLATLVEAVAPPTIAAPSITNFAGFGSTTWSWRCTGTDVDGNTFPGTDVTITNGPASIPGGSEIIVACPYSAGAITESIWRTAGPGTTGFLSTSAMPAVFDDTGTSTSGTPPATNSSVPKSCVGGSEVSCWITSASAPTGSCTNGWFDTNQSGSPATLYQCVSGAWTASGSGSGVPSVNSITGAVTVAAGSNVTVSTAGSTVTIATAGSAGSGAVGSGSQYLRSTYPNSGSTTTVGPTPNEQTLPTGLSTSQINTALGTAHIATTLQAGAAPVPFSNSAHHVPIHDDNDVVPEGPWNARASGAVCDAQQIQASITHSSTTITAGAIFTAAINDGTTWVETVGADPSTGEQIRFDATLTYVNATTATLSAAAPFTNTSGYFIFGHKDDAALADAIGVGLATGREVDMPNGTCWTSVPQILGANIVGHGSLVAGFNEAEQGTEILGSAGEDVFQSSSAIGVVPAGFNTGNYTISLSAGIDATKPWRICSNGTCTEQTPLYRPIGILGPDAQDPLAPQWIEGTAAYNSGATNGVATMTNGSAVACVPSSEALPAIGQQIVFPYQAVGTAMFQTTVSSHAGAGCAGGTNPMTLAATWSPSTPGAPVEWFSGTSFQNIQTAIPAGTARTAAITAYSITSNVATFTASNGYSSGQKVTLSGFPTATFFNGQQVTILSSGLSSSQFEANFTHANASATEAGSASIFPLVVALANPIIPIPALVPGASPAGVGPFGYVQIGAEQCAYYGNSNYPANAASVSSPTITLQGCAQGGTSAAAHSVNAIIVPLNPFEPSWPWPVTPSIGGVQTPANAEFFPAQNVGNAAISVPTPDGADYSSAIAISGAHLHDLLINIGGGFPSTVVQGGQIQNDTAAMYITVQPFSSTFSDIQIESPFYGIVEGAPSTNTNSYFTNGFPTADGNHWTNIRVQSAALPMDIISEGSGMFSGLTFFSESWAPPNNYIPGFVPGTQYGAQANLMLDGPFDDQINQYPYPNTGVQFTTFQFKYLEPETGFFNQTQPLDYWNCAYCTWINTTPKGSGVRFIDGAFQQFYGGTLNINSTTPIIITGTNINFDRVAGMGSSFLGTTYGSSAVLNWGENNSAYGPGDNGAGTVSGPNIPQLTGGVAAVLGQSDDTLATGNTLIPYVAKGLGYFPPDQMPPSSLDPGPMTGNWTFDATSPISNAYVTCAGPSGYACTPIHMTGDGVSIGPNQRIVAGPYYGHVSIKTPNGAANFTFRLFANGAGSCSGATVFSTTITTPDAGWHDYPISLADLTGDSGCLFSPNITNGSVAFNVQVGYLDLTPLPNSMMLPVTTPTEGSACSLPGSFLGSDASYIYVCASGGTVKRVGIS